ncbi:MAG: hypothetical protein JW786_13185 [Desulfobacterales bacterium]|nr:hypothetical protein [Desulfobacterales bacterium]
MKQIRILLGVVFTMLFLSVNIVEGEDVLYKTHGMNFSPYIDAGEDPEKGGTQITDQELEERLNIVVPFTKWIRTYGCNDDLKEAGQFSHAKGLSAAVGAWLSTDLTENQNQIDCLVEAAKAGHVDLAVIGCEVLLRGDLTEEQLISYIRQVKNRLAEDPTVDIPVTTADVYGVLLAHPALFSEVDIVFVNYYPYWEGCKIDLAIAHLHRWHNQMTNAVGGKEVIVSETGWPSCGEQIGEAVPSPENAGFYFLNFVSWARANSVKYFYFEALDEKWKTKHEGPQGACWGIWDKDGNLKPGMQDVFDNKTMGDNWSNPIPETPVIDFRALPERITTNISTFIVAGWTDPNNEVRLNNIPLPPGTMDKKGNFALPVPLDEGDNLLNLEIESVDGEFLETIGKIVYFNQDLSTRDKRLLYVNAVYGGDGVPSLPGTIVIDLDGNTLLGLIKDQYAVNIAPDGSTLYMSDKTAMSTATHRELRSLPFSQDIPYNGVIVSPDGSYLYSRNQRLDVSSNTLLENLPVNILTGSSFSGAPIPGGPFISENGNKIYCRNNIMMIDTLENTAVNLGISGYFMSDIALTPDGKKILVIEYSDADGRVDMYDAGTYKLIVTLSGLGDFAGEMVFSKNGKMAVVGSAGNPASATNGRITVIDIEKMQKVSQINVPLADNLTTSGNNEFFVSSGENDLFRRLGIDVYVLESSGNLKRIKSFFLGINGFIPSTGEPKNDQIRRILFKPSAGPSVCEGDFDGDSDVDDSDLAVFAADFGRTDCETGDICEGNFDGDNDADGSDLTIFAADFGRTDCP